MLWPSVGQFFSSRSARLHLSQVQLLFTVANYLTTQSYLTCWNELGKISRFSYANQVDIISSAEPFPSLQKLFPG
jgi:hypothetical protein